MCCITYQRARVRLAKVEAQVEAQVYERLPNDQYVGIEETQEGI